jgi:hypothetical protein
MELAPAIERVASELKTLRAVVDAAAGCRAADYLRAEIERTKSLLAARNEELVTKQAQCRAGLMKERDLMSYVAAADAPRTAFHVLHEELTKRTAADAAQVELTRIADALR